MKGLLAYIIIIIIVFHFRLIVSPHSTGKLPVSLGATVFFFFWGGGGGGGRLTRSG